jgi:hypothetical protein
MKHPEKTKPGASCGITCALTIQGYSIGNSDCKVPKAQCLFGQEFINRGAADGAGTLGHFAAFIGGHNLTVFDRSLCLAFDAITFEFHRVSSISEYGWMTLPPPTSGRLLHQAGSVEV